MDHVEESTRLAQHAAELLNAREDPNPVAVAQLALTHALLAMIQIEVRESEEHKTRMTEIEQRRGTLVGLTDQIPGQ